MNKSEILNEIKVIERELNVQLSDRYKQFLSEDVQDKDVYEIQTSRGEVVYLYNYKDLLERNKTYGIQDVEPDYVLIGQDGDVGYFINGKGENDWVYSLDLGALGSLDMNEEATDIYKLIS